MRAQGYWTWWNQYGSESIETCVQRVKDAGLAGVIVKHGYPAAREAFIQAGILWATERYTYPNQPTLEAGWLAADVAHGAQFAVINAEVEWQNWPADPMERLIARFRELQPQAELYASVDTRGDRTNLPYQRVLGANIAGWMPMVYPLAFYPHRPAGYVASAFRDCLDGKSFQGKPVLPTIQTYDNIGAGAVDQEMAEVAQRGLPGCQAYTVGHATGAEWQAFREGIPGDDEMTDEERKRLADVEDLLGRVRDDAVFGKNNSKRNEDRLDAIDKETERWRAFAEAVVAYDHGLVPIVGALGERIVGAEGAHHLLKLAVDTLHPDAGAE